MTSPEVTFIRARCAKLAAVLPPEHRATFLELPLRSQVLGLGCFAVIADDEPVADSAKRMLAYLDSEGVS